MCDGVMYKQSECMRALNKPGKRHLKYCPVGKSAIWLGN